MTENAYTVKQSEIQEQATWAINNLLESGQDDLAADVARSYERELLDLRTVRTLPRAS